MKGKWHRRRLLFLLILLIGALWICLPHIIRPDYRNDGLLRVCIDPGHGGSDPGAIDRTGLRQEKDDCLSLALAVEACLKENYPDIEVELTRGQDSYPTLEQRCKTARNFRADLFVSIHRNSAPNDAQGTEIWIPSGKPAPDKALADAILQNLEQVGLSKNRGVKGGTANNPNTNYYVLGNTNMPACLIELGFITDAEDNRLLNLHHAAYARAIADGIAAVLLTDK